MKKTLLISILLIALLLLSFNNTLNEDAHFSYWANQGVKFSSGETLFQITLSVNAEKTDGSDEYYIPNAEGGATYRNVGCYVSGDYAIMFEGEEPPLEWRAHW